MKQAATALVLLLALTACRARTQAVETVIPLGTPSGTPFSYVFAVKGDWGSGTDKQRLVTDRMCEARALYGFTDVVTTGDNFYNPDGTATARNFYEPEACLKGVTWHATWGNHDIFGQATGLVLGAERWYTWSRGDIQFFALDSNQPSNPEQRAWLEEALSASTARIKIVVFHHPPYTASVHPPDEGVRRNWVPLFERYGVALVLTGHNHNYEHWVVNDIDYVISGGGGGTVYPCYRSAPELQMCDDVYHFLLIGLRDGELVVRAVRGSGATLDEFSIGLPEGTR